VTGSLFHFFGDVSFPVDGDDVTDGQLFSVLDPGRDALLSLFQSAINYELGGDTASVLATSAWAAARASTPLADARPVADVLWTQPHERLMRETSKSFPLLCLYRTTGEIVEHTIGVDRLVQRWGIDYILPPLDAAHERKLAAVLSAVTKIVALVLDQGCHPAHDSGAAQFGPGSGRFARIRLLSSQEGLASFNNDSDPAPYLACHLELETWEESGLTNDGAFTDFEGVNVHAGVGGTEGILPDLVNASTDVNPDPNHGQP
jgi:hypothetical protein